MKAQSQLDLRVPDLNLAPEVKILSFIELPVNLVESAASEIKFPSQFVENTVAACGLNCSVCAIQQTMN